MAFRMQAIHLWDPLVRLNKHPRDSGPFHKSSHLPTRHPYSSKPIWSAISDKSFTRRTEFGGILCHNDAQEPQTTEYLLLSLQATIPQLNRLWCRDLLAVQTGQPMNRSLKTRLKPTHHTLNPKLYGNTEDLSSNEENSNNTFVRGLLQILVHTKAVR